MLERHLLITNREYVDCDKHNTFCSAGVQFRGLLVKKIVCLRSRTPIPFETTGTRSASLLCVLTGGAFGWKITSDYFFD
jgi:hypothetical protein